MFTGIIEEVGKVKAIQKGKSSGSMTIQASTVLEGTKIGDSIAVNGVCLTVTSIGAGTFSADVMPETLSRSSLGSLKPSTANGSAVNLERAMQLGGRFGGHIVSGHIDGTGKIQSIKQDDNAVWYKISAATHLLKYIIEKGSITIDGISLTVAKVHTDSFEVSVIPHTRAVTSLSQRKVGDQVNLENDCIGKYIERLMNFGADEQQASSKSQSAITKEFLLKNGF